MKTYEVPMIYRGLANFIVSAETQEEAEKIARSKFTNGDQPDMLGNEAEEIERVGEIKELTNSNNGD